MKPVPDRMSRLDDEAIANALTVALPQHFPGLTFDKSGEIAARLVVDHIRPWTRSLPVGRTVTAETIRAAWPKTDSGDDLAVWHPAELIGRLASLPVGDDGPSLDVERLARAIRLTEQAHADTLGVVGPATSGPPPEWYDAFAARIAAEYARLAPR